MYRGHDDDVEKGPQVFNNTVPYDASPASNGATAGAVPGESFEYGDSLYAKIQRVAGKLHIEQRGIERVPEDERTDTSYLNISSMVCFLIFCALRNQSILPPLPLTTKCV